MRKKMFEHAVEMLECAVGDLELRPGGSIGIKGVPQDGELQGDRDALAVSVRRADRSEPRIRL